MVLCHLVLVPVSKPAGIAVTRLAPPASAMVATNHFARLMRPLWDKMRYGSLMARPIVSSSGSQEVGLLGPPSADRRYAMPE